MSDYIIPRDVLMTMFRNPRWVKAFEAQQAKTVELDQIATLQVPATEALQDATFLTLSPNTGLSNEYVLRLGEGIGFDLSSGSLILALDNGAVKAAGGFDVRIVASGDTRVTIPLTGTLATLDNTETLTHKTLDAPKLSGLVNAANDAAAAVGGVPVTGVYRNGSVLMVRIV